MIQRQQQLKTNPNLNLNYFLFTWISLNHTIEGSVIDFYLALQKAPAATEGTYSHAKHLVVRTEVKNIK